MYSAKCERCGLIRNRKTTKALKTAMERHVCESTGMTNQEILTKAIEKAIAGGWKDPYAHHGRPFRLNVYQSNDYHIIFNHEFAKSLWGERQTRKPTTEERNQYTGGGAGGYYLVKEGWQHHLQMMVISDDPTKYLGENL